MSTPVLEDVFSYEFGIDINTGTQETPVWVPFKAPTAINPGTSPVTTDRASYDNLGSPNDTKISESWTLDFNALAFRYADGTYGPEIEKIMELTGPDAVGEASVGHFRWYDKPAEGSPNPKDAFEGVATPTLTRGATGNAEGGVWGISLAGKGRRKRIENPFEGYVDGLPVFTDPPTGP